jgi:hypothetical protein
VLIPLHKRFVDDREDQLKTLGWLTFTIVDTLQLLASVRVAVYVPTANVLNIPVEFVNKGDCI